MVHRLIAIATSRYDHLGPADQRRPLEAVLISVVDLFTRRLGVYQHELSDIALNPRHDVMAARLDDWFGSEERDPSDWVVLYYTGHAEVTLDDSLYLLTTEFRESRHLTSAFNFNTLVTMIAGRTPTGRP